jgi:magnesium transporter
VLDRAQGFCGVLPIRQLLVTDPDVMVGHVMSRDVVRFDAADPATEAAQAFERYDLVTAPVLDAGGKLVGRVTVNAVVDFIRERNEEEHLKSAGLREDEDVFASVWKSARNRWLWLAINLFTAFLASRVIGAFEGTIAKFVALATLMPMVAGIAGNSGNQTTTLLIRSIALGQAAATRHFITKELLVSCLNGLVWGGVAGLFAYALYGNVALGFVLLAAVFLNLLVGVAVGLLVPIAMVRLGRDPAMGSSVLLTFTTDSMGFFIFLGLATWFLI